MSKQLFKEDGISILNSNRNILRLSSKSMANYNKLDLYYIIKYFKGINAVEIFTVTGF